MEINFKKIEQKWQRAWEEKKIYEVSEKSKKPKFYILEMFPYPSGTGLHMGHALNYIIGDIYARFKRAQGFNVMHPMGYDSLGLPAENAAIKEGIHPEEYTKQSIKNFEKQFKSLGLSYDWSRRINSSSPNYYKWDQWIFLKMFEKGLAYQKTSAVNWCPKCKTVLANEQAQGGVCERCGSKVEVRKLKQWFLKITDYANELLDEIDSLDWPARTKTMQKNWIGRSKGTEIDFEVNGEKWPIFTTRPDTIFGVTFLVISAQHNRLDELVTKEQRKEVDKFLKRLNSVSEKELANLEKEGVFTGSYAIHPLTNEKLPIYAGNFVVADYGSGMVMAVPAHDKRDFQFARKYNIPLKVVISPIEFEINENKIDGAYVGKGILINSGEFNGLDSEDAKKKITHFLEKKNLGRKVVQFKLRDWLISRQRYWGTPIPIIHCEKCGAVALSEKDLPLKLPKNVKFGKGNPLETATSWVNVKCPKCGGKAKRETDTMDTFVNSSWYYLRYCDPKNNKKIFDKKKVDYWCPIDLYIGGAEHACMHLIYFRFYTKFLRDLGLLNFSEPAKRVFHQGILHGEDGEKMSKSKGNGVLPEEVSEKYGMDTARMFLISLATPDKDIDWSEKGIKGTYKFINKLFDYFNNVKIGKADLKTESKLNKTIKEVTSHIESFKYNLAVIKIRDLFNSFPNETSKEVLEKFLKLLSPICPHISEELWEKIGGEGFVSLASWPKADESKINEDFERAEEAIEKLARDINHVKEMFERKTKAFVYVLPNEKQNYIDNLDILKKKTHLDIEIFAVNDKDKYDPDNKSKKVKPGRPGIYLE